MDVHDGAELEFRALEWVHGIVRDWLAVNETARSRQLAMSAADQEQLARLPAGFGFLGEAMATLVNPESLIVANAVLASAEVQVRSLLDSGSLSHPIVSFGTKAEMGVGTVGGDDDLMERVRYLEAENASLRRTLRGIGAAANSALDEGLVQRAQDAPAALVK